MKTKPSKRLQDEVFPGFTERSERGRTSRARGVGFERAIAKKLKVAWRGAKRSFGQARDGNEVPDIVGTDFWIECADGKTRTIHEKLCQAIEDSKSSPSQYAMLPPIVISHHVQRGLTMVTMRLEDFIAIANQLKVLRHGDL